jgi:hypothetical protein
MGGVAAAVALARKGKDLAAEMPRLAAVSYKLIYGRSLYSVCYTYATNARAVCVWIEKTAWFLS